MNNTPLDWGYIPYEGDKEEDVPAFGTPSPGATRLNITKPAGVATTSATPAPAGNTSLDWNNIPFEGDEAKPSAPTAAQTTAAAPVAAAYDGPSLDKIINEPLTRGRHHCVLRPQRLQDVR